MKKILLYSTLVFIFMAGLVTVSGAIPVLHREFQAFLGGSFRNHASISATDQGFSVSVLDAAAEGTNSGSPVMFPSTPVTGVRANTALIFGDWLFTVFLQPTANTPANTEFSVVFFFHCIFPCSSFNGVNNPMVLYIATGSTVDTSTAISASFDLGPSLESQFTYEVSVSSI